MKQKRKPRQPSATTSALQRDAIRAVLPCPINYRARVIMTRAAVISACLCHSAARGGSHAGKRGASTCDACQTGKAIRAGRKVFPLPQGVKLYTKAQFGELQAAYAGALPWRRCHGAV